MIDHDKKFDADDVKIYFNERDYFRKFLSVFGDGFYQRTLDGKKIQGYSKMITTYHQSSPGTNDGGGYHK